MDTPTLITNTNVHALRITPVDGEIVRFKMTMPTPKAEQLMLASLYAKLLPRGTKEKDCATFTDALESLGVDLSVTPDNLGVTITCTTLAGKLTAAVVLVREMLEAPAFAPKEIKTVHAQYRQMLHDEEDDARERARSAFSRTLYDPSHPYYMPSVETRRAFLETLTVQKYRELHATLRAGRVYVSVVGTPAAHKRIVSLCEEMFTGATVHEAAASAVPVHEAATVYQSVPSRSNVELFIGNSLPLTTDHDDYIPFQFGLQVLGKWGGFSGRLMSRVREQEGLTYTIYARTQGNTPTMTGMWYIFTFFTPQDLSRGLTSTRREIDLIVRKGVTSAEVRRFKELNVNQFALAHESSRSALALYHSALCIGITPGTVHALQTAVQKVTKKEVDRALQMYMDPKRLVISGAGPVTEKGAPLA